MARFHPIRSLFSGDIALIMAVMGLQSTSARCPCYKCLMILNDLRKRYRFKSAESRDVIKMDGQAELVQSAKEVTVMKKLAQQNDSVIAQRLWNISLNQICVPILHIILGITKKIFDVMVLELQQIDNTSNDFLEMKHVSDNLNYFVSSENAKTNQISSRLEGIEKQHDNATKAYRDAMMDSNMDCNNYNVKEMENNVQQLTAEKKDLKNVKITRKKRDTIVKAVKAVLVDMKTFSKSRMGNCERLIERMISESPINCKHNPYYSGSFNGNDCLRLVENMDYVFDELKK